MRRRAFHRPPLDHRRRPWSRRCCPPRRHRHTPRRLRQVREPPRGTQICATSVSRKLLSSPGPVIKARVFLGRQAGATPNCLKRALRGGDGLEVAQRGQPCKGLALELPHALAREVELLADGLERPRLAFEPEAELEDAALALRKRVERLPDALAPERLLGLVERVGGL